MFIELTFWERLGAFNGRYATERERFARKFQRSHESIHPPKGATVERDTKRETFRTLYAQDSAYEDNAAIARESERRGAILLNADHLVEFTSRGMVAIGPIGAQATAIFVEPLDSPVVDESADRAA